MKKISPSEQWDTFVRRGKQAGKDQDLNASAEYMSAAYKLSRTFAKSDERRAESAFLLAFVKFIEKKSSDAAKLFNEYLSTTPLTEANKERQKNVHATLGAIYFGMDMLNEAEKHLRDADGIERSTGKASWENQQFLASVFTLQKKYDEAIPCLEFLFKHQLKTNLAEARKTTVLLAFAFKEKNNRKKEVEWQKKNLSLYEKMALPAVPAESLSKKSKEVPEGWGKDGLSHFLEACRRNEFHSFAERKNQYETMSALNERFIENKKSLIVAVIAEVNRLYTDKKFDEITLAPQDWLEIYFYLRCQSSFTAAVRLALSAQVPETYMVLRGCLENALYAWQVSKKPNLKAVWLARHDSKTAEQAVRDNFQIGGIKKNIKLINDDLGSRINTIYDETLDKGAHPNVQTFSDNAEQKNADGVLLLSVSTLNPSQLDQLFVACETIAKLVFEIYTSMYPDYFE